MFAQLWVQVGGGEGLEVVVVEGCVRPWPGCGNRSGYPARALEGGFGGVGIEVLSVRGGVPGGPISIARWRFARSRPYL
jgi:hypothetical protein